ncbi:HAD hydrolase-like protein [Photobacterium lutimaris]|uniref:Haloacid dehalogenase-like hydrolase n=1 Tax=Photobacterium lutimaris TaxID=388278 RepID=A0A2T3J152_9GAMM|nr:HAD hydrolase-like protein [Photobacterium lutimaris]PSU34824.1 haloacid dehalogenase-like hydrolase [Photobacterium lutimaris]TDR77158.1 haloacid dehalogenase-like hydrolase [Photobacterium lutimaris]
MANLFLLDIDGALVDSHDLELDCYVKAVNEVLGIEMDTDLSQYANLTDAGVLDELIAKYAIAESRSLIHRKVENRFSSLVQQAIKEYPETVSEAMGAKAFLTKMKDLQDTYIAIATSGWASTAKLKLRAAGFDVSNLTFTSASDALSRTEIMALAAFRAKQDSGVVFERRVVFAKGDRNKHASQELGYDYVEVGIVNGPHTHIPNLAHYQAAFSRLALSA